MPFQENELINLVLGAIGFLVLLAVFLPKRIPNVRFLYAGFGLALASQICTVAEGFVYPQFFNLVEHLCHGLSGVCLAVGTFRLLFRPGPIQGWGG